MRRGARVAAAVAMWLVTGRVAAQQAPRDTTLPPVARRDTVDGALGAPLIAPALTYTPETGFAAGVGAFAITQERRLGQRPDTWGANLLVTQRGQFTLAGSADVWTRNNRLRVETDVAALRFPNRYFGLGLETPRDGERYTPTTLTGAFTVQKAVRRALYLGVRAAADRTWLDDLDPAGTLVARPERNGWSLLTLGALVTHDTRDRLFAPRHGGLRSLTIARTDRALGATFDATRVTVDVRQYVALHPRAVFAVQGRLDHVEGALPFERLPQLGGPTLLRGYFAGRFRERSLGIGQAEVRLGPWADVVGLTVFAASGGVAPDLATLRDTRFRRAAGAGLRLVANPASGLALRIDWAQGERGSRGWYITVGEAF